MSSCESIGRVWTHGALLVILKDSEIEMNIVRNTPRLLMWYRDQCEESNRELPGSVGIDQSQLKSEIGPSGSSLHP